MYISCVVSLLFILETLSLILISTGYNKQQYELKSTEVINLDTQVSQVPSYQNHLNSLFAATGGWVGNKFIVCGGLLQYNTADISKECYIIGKETTVKHGDMMEKRAFAASIVLDESLWILGGKGSPTTSEFFFANDGSSKEGPALPIGIHRTAAIKINTTTSMLISGYCSSGNCAKTYYYLHESSQWINGPDLIQFRNRHSACLIKDSVTQESFIVVTGGIAAGDILDSVEILNIHGPQWTSGN